MDIAFLETLFLFDEARTEAERQRNLVQNNARELQANKILVSDMVSTFFSFLRHLLCHVFLPGDVLLKLDRQLDVNSNVLRKVIASNENIALGLEHDEECGQKVLNELSRVQNFIEGQMEVSSKKNNSHYLWEMNALKQYIGYTKLEEEKQQKTTQEAEKVPQQSEDYADLIKQVPKLYDECRTLRQNLDLTMKQVTAQRNEIAALVEELETKHKESERMHLEGENKTVWRTIRAWVVWVFSWGFQ